MLRFLFLSVFLVLAVAVTAAGALLWWIVPQLPTTAALRDVRFQTPLKVYSSEGLLIAEFGEQRRIPVSIKEVPDLFIKAFIAAEDDRFYSHPGVDWMGVLRAAWDNLRTGEKTQGASTITMLVAKEFFLSPEKTYERKLKQALLALKLEREFSKDEILELFLNKIFLGHRAYGIGAAAQVYYGKTLDELTLPEIAMIAGLPQAPSTTNPVSNPARALERRGYVLRRMLELDFIDRSQHAEAMNAPVAATLHGQRTELDAPYLAEMVRSFMQERYGDEAQTAGFRVYTTLEAELQETANRAVRDGLLAYDARHGYRGPEQHIDLPGPSSEEDWVRVLADFRVLGGLHPALVVGVEERALDVYVRGIGRQRVEWDGLKWARRYIDEDRRGPVPENAAQVARAGDIIRVALGEAAQTDAGADGGAQPLSSWRLAQLPEVEGALVSLNPDNGAVLALVGGFDFNKSKFNRVMQARRQPGSNFKPFIYSAALAQGYTPASFINDAPIVFDAPGLEAAWRPENYSGRYYGPTRLREALAHSRNLVSIRLLKALGIDSTIEYLGRFGFPAQRLPHNLSLSLGSGELTPLEIVSGYAVFANGGYRVEPFFVQRIERGDADVVHQADPISVCRLCERRPELITADGEPVDIEALVEMTRQGQAGRPAPRVVDAINAWLMTSMMQDVIRTGTGQRALALKRNDLAGKTGTTNDQKDAWFSGFNREIVTTAWVGFDQTRPLGRNETGAVAALPLWMDFMRVALDGMPPSQLELPEGVVTVRIDPNTGLMTDADNPNAIFESFRAEDVERLRAAPGLTTSDRLGRPEQIF
jgi:penicillin-binding protein 1A